MYSLLLVASDRDIFEKMAGVWQTGGKAKIEQVGSGGDALDWLSSNKADLVVAAEQLNDMTGLEFARKLVFQNPMVNCTLVSTLDPEGFHEASEGLGILVQLPPDPGEAEAEDVMKKLDNIMGMGV